MSRPTTRSFHSASRVPSTSLNYSAYLSAMDLRHVFATFDSAGHLFSVADGSATDNPPNKPAQASILVSESRTGTVLVLKSSTR